MLKKVNLPILLTIVCIFLLLVVLLYANRIGKLTFLGNKNEKQIVVEEIEKKNKKIVRGNYYEVARRTLDWIDKQRNEWGWYILGKNCSDRDCEQIKDDKEIGNKNGLITTWVRLNFYGQYQDPKDLEIVKKDINLFYDKYKDKEMNDSLWLCKVTYEMAQSKYLDKGQKNKLKELCLKKEITGFDVQGWKEEKINAVKNNDFDKGVSFSYYFIDFMDLGYRFGDVSDIFYKYKFSGNSDYIKEAKQELLNVSNKIDDESNISNKCLLGIGAVDLYKLSKSKDDLDLAINVYDTVTKNEQLPYDPFCGLLIKSLYEITSENKYLTVLENNNKALIENYNEYNLGSFFVTPNVYPKRDIFMNGLFVEIIR